MVDSVFSSLGRHALSSLIKLVTTTDIFHHFFLHFSKSICRSSLLVVLSLKSYRRTLRTLIWYPDDCLPRKITARLCLGFRSRLGLVLGLGGNQTIAPEKNLPLVRVRVWVWVSFGFGGNFPHEQLSQNPSVSDLLLLTASQEIFAFLQKYCN